MSCGDIAQSNRRRLRLPPVVEPPPSCATTRRIIASMTVSSPRVEADQDSRRDARLFPTLKRRLDQLTYQWSATPVGGTFTSGVPDRDVARAQAAGNAGSLHD